ncbi:MAG TPA: hypothetical protein VGG31_03340 [Candidatus Dormibacteraeota bacterium]
MRTVTGWLIAMLLVSAALMACGSGALEGMQATAPAQAAAAPSTHPTPNPTPASAPAAAAAPSTSPVAGPPAPAAAPTPVYRALLFTGLPVGVYPTHLHSICNGGQAFHIAVLQTLVVSAGGMGSVSVPSSYFGRGLCVIVYTNANLTRVLTTRHI